MATLRFSSILLVCCISICYAHSRYRIWKRDSIFNFGGADNSQNIEGDRNSIFGSTQSPANVGQETLIRKTAHQIGRLLEGGTDVITSPVRWLAHMQENWLTYLVCITALVVSSLIIYCCIQSKLSQFPLPHTLDFPFEIDDVKVDV